MKRKLVQAGNSLAVTLPAHVVQQHGLEKGMSIEVSVHPRTGVVTIHPGVLQYEGGETTPRFEREAEALLDRRTKLYRNLAR